MDTLAERLAASVDPTTACVLVSSVLFEIGGDRAGPRRSRRRLRASRRDLLVDAYHHLNVVPFDIVALGLNEAFVLGGGYKYCQLGEGNCFLRVPAGCELRPVLTGWFSEFAELADAKRRRRSALRRGRGAFRRRHLRSDRLTIARPPSSRFISEWR